MVRVFIPRPRITGADIVDLSITGVDLADYTVSAVKIAEWSLGYSKFLGGITRKAYTYIITVSGGTAIALNCETSAQQFTSVNHGSIINSVLAAINTAGGGSVLIKAGVYEIETPLIVYSNTTIEGEGEATVLTLDDGVDDNVITNYDWGAGNTDITIKNLKINGNYANQSAGHGIFMKKVSRVIFEGLHINGTWDNGIHLEDAIYDVLISGCLVNQANLGINVYAAAVVCARITLVETIVKASRTYQGIHFKGTAAFAISDVIVSNCMSYENVQDDGILFEYVNRGIIKNCIFRDNGTFNGIDLVGLTDIIVIGNVCYGNADCGIIVGDSAIAGTDRCTIVGNICRDNGNYGILLNTNTDSDENVVANNICTGNNEGIVIGATCDGNIIIGNNLLGNTTNNLVNSGANNIVEHNNT